MRLAVVIGMVVGLITPLVAVALISLGALRCIDSPQFFNPQPLGWAGSGIGLITAGAIGIGARRRARLSVLALTVGALFVGFALAGPPYFSCPGPGVIFRD